MIIIADSPRPHKRILQKGEWRDGGGGRGAAQTALRAVSAAFGRSGGSAAGGCAPISAPFAHPPGGRLAGPASSRKPAKKAGRGRGSLSRRGSPAESPPSPVSLSLHTSPAQTSPRYHQILPNPPPSPGKIPPRPRKKAPPPSGRRFAHIFWFSPAWQGRHGCGRGSPHGPAPPPALCRRRG